MMTRFLAALLVLVAGPAAAEGLEGCRWNDIDLWGDIQVVQSFPDIKVKVVESWPDLKVKIVESFPDECGRWRFVDSFPDFKIQFVESFPDLKIKYVESWPGVD